MNSTVSLPDVIAVVPAAGIGSRMQSDRPKQYLTIGQHTLLEYSIASLLKHPAVRQVIVALHPDDQQFSQLPLASDPRITAVTGGDSRADSVFAGLQAITGSGWVLVHDAARPCLHPDDLQRLLQLTLTSQQGGILASPVRDTMKRAGPRQSLIAHTVDREGLWHALTPQLFPVPLLRECLPRAMAEGAVITDEASAVEHCGYHPQLVHGRSDNIKVTRPEDLALAEFFLTRIHAEENA
ncbi:MULTISPECIES: 2-C-methyl-D-erythritol 4-phosphate cytidylyltransferase [Tatumella]|uniref:2-C-methyl-D-erythritol 4-phosphate cytidylyltransferase n=1 Tax=Tatumella punctata TaxID=399969 RepID=A0ABW1VPR7_9GAMM|nr:MULTISPECIES: 2-C-methyl-D-erythritol 4-phosphate cytidylyltransferase [unclassified Tatumella]MBS0855856.1 2-C-methyl-D-erythritol 4-phosphate cytidylyltransferase [Tatumella sp. JGM16]MBS0877019.1 2-C-methyl-D-erythritol 4-phosphate cytidylyltransferase [Tatumella sp. JGM82]MBS0890844.1 2-C-methyl-D-erythritol 4-phosphate cytidylyltransferase [Tatumella sp. JGM94]MBS0895292.1 2-C-methyl-D-erythritol 4-phosphate cytidylyltransferase [Tatumella sp. JGM130]MBS0901911.1 2-C-methyl-D-erythrito